MPTPNSPGAESADIHADPAFRAQFGGETGPIALQQANVGASIAAPPPRRCNVGLTEQRIRLVVGGALLGAAAFARIDRSWRIALATLGAAEIVTGARRHCPLWQALGIDTNKVRGLS